MRFPNLRLHRDLRPKGAVTVQRRSKRVATRLNVESLEGRALLSAGGVKAHMVPAHAVPAHVVAAPVHAQPRVQAQARAPRFRGYIQTNLVSDGTIPAAHTDTNLVNAWGLTSGPNTPFWVAANGTGVSTLYDGSGNAQALVVTIPPPNGGMPPSAPTGATFNESIRPTDFQVNGSAAHFIFSTEDGTIAAWSSGSTASIVVDNSSSGAVYKGLAMANTAIGELIYATDFHNDKVDVFDANFQPVTLGTTAFTDPRIPTGFAPFGIANVGGNLVVTFAQQDADKHDDVAGRGHGFVDIFDPAGNLVRRVAARGTLNSPWGIAVAPAGFGRFAGDLLIGNFGDGRINAFRTDRGHWKFDGQLTTPLGRTIVIGGLWGLKFGSNVGNPNTLFFTAGPDDESHGLFGTLAPVVG